MARITIAQLQQRIQELESEVSKWQGYHLEVLQENGKLRDQLDSKQISEHSGIINQLEQELKTQKEVNRHLRESLARQREKLSAKDNIIDRLRKQIEQEPVPDLPEPKRGTSGRPRKKISQEQEQEILSLIAQGYSQRVIARQYNISAAYVAKISKRRQTLSEPF